MKGLTFFLIYNFSAGASEDTKVATSDIFSNNITIKYE